eukprot:PhF_6_TR43527/c0_g1_i1/m.66817
MLLADSCVERLLQKAQKLESVKEFKRQNTTRRRDLMEMQMYKNLLHSADLEQTESVKTVDVIQGLQQPLPRLKLLSEDEGGINVCLETVRTGSPRNVTKIICHPPKIPPRHPYKSPRIPLPYDNVEVFVPLPPVLGKHRPVRRFTRRESTSAKTNNCGGGGLPTASTHSSSHSTTENPPPLMIGSNAGGVSPVTAFNHNHHNHNNNGGGVGGITIPPLQLNVLGTEAKLTYRTPRKPS